MHVYLVRHAEALSHREDDKRPLSQRGKEEAKHVAHFLKKRALVSVDEVWHSTKLRAKQTAEIFVKELAWNIPLKEMPGLGPDDDIDEIAGRLNAEQKSVMIVGHMPYLGHLASFLVMGRENFNTFHFELSAVLSISAGKESVIQWMIGPSVIPA